MRKKLGIVLAAAAVAAGCGENEGEFGCGGATCPFSDPVVHAVIAGRLSFSDGTPGAGLPVLVQTMGTSAGCRGLAGRNADAGGEYRVYLVFGEQLARCPAGDTVTVRVTVRRASPGGQYVPADSATLRVPFRQVGLEPPVSQRDFVLP